MAEPGLSPAGEIVRRLDPPLFLAALFAPEPARERLLVLAAYDIELSRAARRAAGSEEGPLLARMRLQFWRDRLAEVERATQDPEPPAGIAAHEVAGPLHALMAGPLATAHAEAEALIDAREAELDTPFDEAAWAQWAEKRFAAWHRLVLAALGCTGSDAAIAAAAAGTLAAAGFTLRHAAPLAGEGVMLLPGVAIEEAGAIVRGESAPSAEAAAAALITQGRAARGALSTFRGRLGRRAAPAFLPLLRAERVLQRAEHAPSLATLATGDAAGLSAGYAWRALTGRW